VTTDVEGLLNAVGADAMGAGLAAGGETTPLAIAPTAAGVLPNADTGALTGGAKSVADIKGGAIKSVDFPSAAFAGSS
jgi:hypothetical protein